MKSYLSLISISAKNRRKQNRLTKICITLAVFLVTVIFSITNIMEKGEEERTIRRHGLYHIAISDIGEETARKIEGQEDVSFAAFAACSGGEEDKGYQIAGKRAVLYGAGQSYIEDIRKYAIEGEFPRNESEVMLSEYAKDALGLRLGDSVTLNTPAGDFAYRISAFCGDDTEDNVYRDCVCVYMGLEELEGMGVLGKEEGRVYYVQFAEGTKLRTAIDRMREAYGIGDGCVKENTFLLGMAGASDNEGVMDVYITVTAVFVIIMIAGALMISSCMNSNVSQRTTFFGMMRCIGASKKQVMRYVTLEALNWCKTAVPAGLGLGLIVCYVLCLILKNLVGGQFSEFSFRISLASLAAGALVGVLTTLIAAHSPARRAAEISPIAAVSGSGETGKKLSHGANTRLFKVETALGIHHGVSSRKNLILMSLSIAFTVTLFFVFFAGLDLVKKLLPSDSSFHPDLSIAGEDGASIDRKLKKEISLLPGVEAVFGNSMTYDVPARVNGTEGSVDLVSYDDYMLNEAKKAVVSGDISKVDKDTDYVLTIFAQGSRLNVGDKVQVAGRELEVACVVSEGIGVGNRPALVCTEETFLDLTGKEDYGVLSIQLAEDVSEETVNKIEKLAGENEFLDRREETDANYSAFWVFRLAVYSFLAIVSLIAAFNIINNLSMSVSARIRQYGAMRAVGMSKGQMIKMIAAEAVTYGIWGLILGCGAGLFLHRLFVTKITITHFGGTWAVPLQPVFIVIVLVLSSCAAAVYAPAKRIWNMAVTETINQL